MKDVWIDIMFILVLVTCAFCGGYAAGEEPKEIIREVPVVSYIDGECVLKKMVMEGEEV
jgi:hypothetical protein